MMRLVLACVGRLKPGPERELTARYLARAEVAGRRLGFGPVTQLELPESRQAQAEARKVDEAAALIEKTSSDTIIVALDTAGEALSSEAFAAVLAGFRERGQAGLTFVIGGADGLGPALLKRAELRLSLGPMVLPHGLARIVLAEQLYRAMTILSGHPYHRG